MVHCCEESFFEVFWAQQLQKIVRGLLHDLSNCLTGSLALSELYCTKASKAGTEKFAIIRDNCYKEREILQQLSRLHHTLPGNVTYIDLQAFINDLQPLFTRLLPSHAKFNLVHKTLPETVIKFDVALLQRVFLLTLLLMSETFENASSPELTMGVVVENRQVSCQIKSSVVQDIASEDLTEINTNNLTLSQIYVPMVEFYLKKHGGIFSYDNAQDGGFIINLTFSEVL